MGALVLEDRVGLPLDQIGEWCTEIVAVSPVTCPFVPERHPSHRWDSIVYLTAPTSTWGVTNIGYQLNGMNYPREDHLCPAELEVVGMHLLPLAEAYVPRSLVFKVVGMLLELHVRELYTAMNVLPHRLSLLHTALHLLDLEGELDAAMMNASEPRVDMNDGVVSDWRTFFSTYGTFLEWNQSVVMMYPTSPHPGSLDGSIEVSLPTADLEVPSCI